ncbi:hypothetical protein ACQ5SA_14405 [Stenotrophomonas indicatrix]
MHLTETARTFCLTDPATEAGTVAKTATEATQVSFDGELYPQHAKPGQVIEVRWAAGPSCLPALGLRNRRCRWPATDGGSLWKQSLVMLQVLRKWPFTMGLNDTGDLFEGMSLDAIA